MYRISMKYTFAVLASLMPILSIASQDLPSVKLKCSGYAWFNSQRFDLKDGFIDLNKNVATVRGFGVPDGKYEVIRKSVREDFLGIKNINQPSIIGSINRISGNASFIEDGPSGQVTDKKIHFHGECVKAKSIF